jgi:hypothetical protein
MREIVKGEELSGEFGKAKFVFYSMHDLDIYFLLSWMFPKVAESLNSIPFASTVFLELTAEDECLNKEKGPCPHSVSFRYNDEALALPGPCEENP